MEFKVESKHDRTVGQRKMRNRCRDTAVIGSAFPERIVDALSDLFDVIVMPPDTKLPLQVAGHADLSVSLISGILFVRKDYYETAAEKQIDQIILRKGLKLRLLPDLAGREYPADCGLCAKPVYVEPASVNTGDNLSCSGDEMPESRRLVIFASKGATYPELTGVALNAPSGRRERMPSSFKEDTRPALIFVRQGYCACAAAACADGALITSDSGIASAASRAGIPCLIIRKGHISLPGYGGWDEGFIGGASGLFGDRLFFSGDPLSHPDGEAIYDFCREHKTKPVPLTGGKLFDGGGILFP